MLQKTETGLTLLFHQAQLCNSRKKLQSRLGPGPPKPPESSWWLQCQSVMGQGRGLWKPLPLDPGFSNLDVKVSCHY